MAGGSRGGSAGGEPGWRRPGVYMRGVGLSALFTGISFTLVLFVVQVPFAAVLGVLIFLGSFVPLIGLTVTGALCVAVTLLEHGIGAAVVVGVAIIVLVLSLIFHRDLFTLIGGGNDSAQTTTASGDAPPPAGTESPAAHREVQFVSFVLDDAQQTWPKILPQAGARRPDQRPPPGGGRLAIGHKQGGTQGLQGSGGPLLRVHEDRPAGEMMGDRCWVLGDRGWGDGS